MVVRVRMRWLVTLVCAGLVVAAPAVYGVTVPGLGLAGLAVVVVVAVQRMRLRADASGVTVVNLTGHHIAWPDISDFRRGRFAFGACIDVCKSDGARVHSWVATSAGTGAYAEAPVFELLTNLRRRLMLENGEIEDALSSRLAPFIRSEEAPPGRAQDVA